jgi:hypothetical protein
MTAIRMVRTAIACLSILMSSAATAGSDESAIKELLMTTFDKPEARLDVDPVIVVGSHAVADWTQQALGGRALLRRQGEKWTLILCSGDGITSAEALQHAGVPKQDAENLSAGLKAAESTIPAERRAILSTFEGIVLMGTSDHPGGGPIQHSKSN